MLYHYESRSHVTGTNCASRSRRPGRGLAAPRRCTPAARAERAPRSTGPTRDAPGPRRRAASRATTGRAGRFCARAGTTGCETLNPSASLAGSRIATISRLSSRQSSNSPGPGDVSPLEWSECRYESTLRPRTCDMAANADNRRPDATYNSQSRCVALVHRRV